MTAEELWVNARDFRLGDVLHVGFSPPAVYILVGREPRAWRVLSSATGLLVSISFTGRWHVIARHGGASPGATRLSGRGDDAKD